MPRVNLPIADDVGLGKTIEAALIMRELILRKRADRFVVAVPPSMLIQWQEELERRFGLDFVILDRLFLRDLRRTRGFAVNPWTTYSRFLISHRLLTEDGYVQGLRDVLGDFAPKSMFVLDEAHHAARASCRRFAIDSQLLFLLLGELSVPAQRQRRMRGCCLPCLLGPLLDAGGRLHHSVPLFGSRFCAASEKVCDPASRLLDAPNFRKSSF